MRADETFIEGDWVLRSRDNPIYSYSDTVVLDQSVVTDLPNGFYKLHMKLQLPIRDVETLTRYLFINSFRPYVFYYQNITDEKDLPRLIDIGRSIVFYNHGLKLDRYYINSATKTVSFTYDDGEDVYIYTDSLFLDDFIPYRLILDYDVKYIEEVFDDYPTVKNQITYIKDVPVVSVNFEPLDILNDISIITGGYRDNNYIPLDAGVTRIARLFNMIPETEATVAETEATTQSEQLVRLEHFDQHDINKLLYDTLPRVNTKGSYGSDLLLIRYCASVVYEKLFEKSLMFDHILVLSDGSLRVPVGDEAELKMFEESLGEMLETDNNIYSITDDINILLAIKLISRTGYIGLIGTNWYLLDTKSIPKHTSKQIKEKTTSIQKWYKKHCKNLTGKESLSTLAKMEVLGKLCYKKDSYNTNMFDIE